MSPKALRVAIVLDHVQLSDVIGMDCFGNISALAARDVLNVGFQDFTSIAPEIEFIIPAVTMDLTWMTPGVKVLPTHTYDNAPRDLDVLLIGGPLPSYRPAEADKFFREAYAKSKIIMTTCIGSLWLASAGVLDGKTATTNREFLPIAKQLYPKTEWKDQRWVVDGNLWTSGGAGAGLDMVITYLLKNFDEIHVRTMVCDLLDFRYPVRDQQYEQER